MAVDNLASHFFSTATGENGTKVSHHTTIEKNYRVSEKATIGANHMHALIN